MENRMDTTLASAADAQLILNLYQLRTEPVMRKARHWVMVEFWPHSAAEMFALSDNIASDESAYLRQVTSYWEMAAAFVLHGALDGDLFVDCNAEPTFIFAKFYPFLAELRARFPDFLVNTEQVINKYPAAKQRLDRQLRTIESRRQQTAT